MSAMGGKELKYSPLYIFILVCMYVSVQFWDYCGIKIKLSAGMSVQAVNEKWIKKAA